MILVIVYECAETSKILGFFLCGSVGLQKYHKVPQIFQQESHCINDKPVSNEQVHVSFTQYPRIINNVVFRMCCT